MASHIQEQCGVFSGHSLQIHKFFSKDLALSHIWLCVETHNYSSITLQEDKPYGSHNADDSDDGRILRTVRENENKGCQVILDWQSVIDLCKLKYILFK